MTALGFWVVDEIGYWYIPNSFRNCGNETPSFFLSNDTIMGLGTAGSDDFETVFRGVQY
jgi:hypothetical protein